MNHQLGFNLNKTLTFMLKRIFMIILIYFLLTNMLINITVASLSPSISIISPKEGIYGDVIKIEWLVNNNNDTSFEIHMYYTHMGTESWHSLNSDPIINAREYLWNTTFLPDGEYKIMVEGVGNNTIIYEKSEVFNIYNGNNNIQFQEGHIIDTTINSSEYVKNGDDIKIIVNVTDSVKLNESDMVANLSQLGGNNAVQAISYDGITAIWTLEEVHCMPENGRLEIIIIVRKIEEKKLYIISDNKLPLINISQPINGLYLNDKKIIPLQKTIIFGNPSIELNIEDENEIKKIRYYLNQRLVNEIFNPNEYKIKLSQRIIGSMMFSAVIVDKAGNQKTIDHQLFIINLF